MSIYDLPIPIQLLIVVGPWIFLLLLISFIAKQVKRRREAKILTFDLEQPSRKLWYSINAESVISKLGQDQLDEALGLFHSDSMKDKLRVRWSYTTPAGRSHYEDELVCYATVELQARLEKAKVELDRKASSSAKSNSIDFD